MDWRHAGLGTLSLTFLIGCTKFAPAPSASLVLESVKNLDKESVKKIAVEWRASPNLTVNTDAEISQFVSTAFAVALRRSPRPDEFPIHAARLRDRTKTGAETFLSLIHTAEFWTLAGHGVPAQNLSEFFQYAFDHLFPAAGMAGLRPTATAAQIQFERDAIRDRLYNRWRFGEEAGLPFSDPRSQVALANVTRRMLTEPWFRSLYPGLQLRYNRCGTEMQSLPDADAAPSISACIALTSQWVSLPQGRHNLHSAVYISNKFNGLVIASEGMQDATDQVACLSNSNTDSRCAVFFASQKLRKDHALIFSDGSLVRFMYFAVDGNRFERINGANLADGSWDQNRLANAVVINCRSCTYVGFASIRAMGQKGLYLGIAPPPGTPQVNLVEATRRWDNTTSDEAELRYCLFRDNGFPRTTHPELGLWSDGLAIERSRGLKLQNNVFWNNTDAQLTIGSAENGWVADNFFGMDQFSYAFTAIDLENFKNFEWGKYTNLVFERNTIDGGVTASLGVGISVGTFLWYRTHGRTSGATFRDNAIRRARQGILLYGADNVVVGPNSIDLTGNYLATRNGQCRTSYLDVTESGGATIDELIPGRTADRFLNCGVLDLQENRLASYEISKKAALDFIVKMYKTQLGRTEVTLDHFTVNWATQLLTGTSRADITQGFRLSEEGLSYLQRSPIRAGYTHCLGHEPTPDALTYWANPPNAYREICASPEGQTYDSLEPVRDFYRRCLNRDASDDEARGWRATGFTLDRIEKEVCESPEASRILIMRR